MLDTEYVTKFASKLYLRLQFLTENKYFLQSLNVQKCYNNENSTQLSDKSLLRSSMVSLNGQKSMKIKN